MRKWIYDEVAKLGVAMGDDPTAERIVLYVDDLVDIPQERLLAAFARTRKEYEYPRLPPLAFIRRMADVGDDDGRPGPEEAWARMPKAERMESDTVVWCEEEQAAYTACRTLLIDGDLIGARMAFKESYEKELAEARKQLKPAKWSISAGYDHDGRISALAVAIQKRRIGVKQAIHFVPIERQDDFARMLPDSVSVPLLAGKTVPSSNLPGLAGVLASMRIDGGLPEELQENPSPTYKKSPESLKSRRETLRNQGKVLKESRKAMNAK